MRMGRDVTPAKDTVSGEQTYRTTVWMSVAAITAVLAIITIVWQSSRQGIQPETVSVPHARTASDDQRQLNVERFLKALEGRPKAPVQIVVSNDDKEAFQLALQFQSLLRSATWTVSNIVEVSQRDLLRMASQPTYLTADDKLVGVAVAMLAESQEEFDLHGNREADTPLNALLEAILETLGTANTYAAGQDVFPAPPPKTLRLVVGSRPPGLASVH